MLLLLIAAVITLCVMRFKSLQSFFRQFVLVEGTEDSQGILRFDAVLELLEREIKKSERYNFPVSVILIEIVKNNSKKIDYLEALQTTVQRSIRDTDVFGFFELAESSENNQFICVLPHTKFHEAYDLSERLRLKLLRNLSINTDSEIDLFDLEKTDLNVQAFTSIKNPMQNYLNISCGISEVEYYEGLDLFIERASEALEMAKIKSGNCTMPQPTFKDIPTTEVAKHLN